MDLAPQKAPDAFYRASRIAHNIDILQPNHAQPQLLQRFIPQLVGLGLVRRLVHASVKFDHQASLVTIEVHDISRNDLLSPEMHAQPHPGFPCRKSACRAFGAHLPEQNAQGQAAPCG